MSKKKPAKFVPKPNRFVYIQKLNDGAAVYERAGQKALKEGLAIVVEDNFDHARCLRRAARWLEYEP